MKKEKPALPKFITASMPITFDIEEIVDDIAYNKDEDGVTIEEIKEYIQDTYMEILSMSKSPAALTDEYGQPV